MCAYNHIFITKVLYLAFLVKGFYTILIRGASDPSQNVIFKRVQNKNLAGV